MDVYVYTTSGVTIDVIDEFKGASYTKLCDIRYQVRREKETIHVRYSKGIDSYEEYSRYLNNLITVEHLVDAFIDLIRISAEGWCN